jgi:hypothetical protein
LAAHGATAFPTRNNDFPQAEQRRAKVQLFTRKETQAVVRLQLQLTISPLTISPVFTLHNSIFVSPHCQLS